MAGNLDWLIMTGSVKVDLMVVRIPTDPEMVVSLVTSLAVTMALMKV